MLDDKDATICRQMQPDIDPTAWLPGDQSVTAPLPVDVPAGRCSLALALVDPVSGKPAIRLAIHATHTDPFDISEMIAKGQKAMREAAQAK